MKTIGLVAGVLAVVGVFFLARNQCGTGSGDTQAAVTAGTVKQVVLPVEGMTCSACAASVTMALKGLEGVQDTKVDVGKKEAAVRYVEGKVTVDQMIQAINKTGFTARKPSAG